MTVREVMAFLAQFDADATVFPCDWEDAVAVRVIHDDAIVAELRWELPEEED